MLSFLDKYRAEAYALLRISSGFMFAFHGAQKILGLWSPYPQPALGSQGWFGGMIELLGGLAVMLGYKAREAAFLCSGTMAVAYAQFHWKGQFGKEFFPINNQGEMAALYAFIFFLIAAQGAGKWALEKR